MPTHFGTISVAVYGHPIGEDDLSGKSNIVKSNFENQLARNLKKVKIPSDEAMVCLMSALSTGKATSEDGLWDEYTFEQAINKCILGFKCFMKLDVELNQH